MFVRTSKDICFHKICLLGANSSEIDFMMYFELDFGVVFGAKFAYIVFLVVPVTNAGIFGGGHVSIKEIDSPCFGRGVVGEKGWWQRRRQRREGEASPSSFERIRNSCSARLGTS